MNERDGGDRIRERAAEIVTKLKDKIKPSRLPGRQVTASTGQMVELEASMQGNNDHHPNVPIASFYHDCPDPNPAPPSHANGNSAHPIPDGVVGTSISVAPLPVVVPGRDPALGSQAIVKTLYEGPNSMATGFRDWMDHPPRHSFLSSAAARARDRAAIHVFKARDYDKPTVSGAFAFKYHRIEVQSPLLAASLQPIMKKHGVHIDIVKPVRFDAPFAPLWFAQRDIIDVHISARALGEPVHRYLGELRVLLDDIFRELRVRERNLVREKGLVDYDMAWTLFPRDATVYTIGANGAEFIAKVETTSMLCQSPKESVSEQMTIDAKVLVFNGVEFVWKTKTQILSKFDGVVPIRDLDHFPLAFHSEAADIQHRCIERGRKALDYQALQYRCYSGIALSMSILRRLDDDNAQKHNIEGRILIDQLGYDHYHLAMGRREYDNPRDDKYMPMAGASLPSKGNGGVNNDQAEGETDSSAGGEGNILPILNKTASGYMSRMTRLTQEEQEATKSHILSNVNHEELGFMYMLVGGYSLTSKQWLQFYIEDIQPMVWNDDAYDHLVYDPDLKDLILTFVENHGKPPSPTAAENKNNKMIKDADGTSSRNKKPAAVVDDVILGKGQGLVILLSGPPGTGKTLTAEAVADRTRRPLLYLQAEDLGTMTEQLAARLKDFLSLATDWGAVVLLDEADVFMAERHASEIHRNELVSIFLRELEYFSGVVFLTTNMMRTIDDAFLSRLSLHLCFNPLSRAARESIWRKLMQRLPPQAATVTSVDDVDPSAGPIGEDDYRLLSHWRLNGREIKNAVKMARTWCDYKGYLLTLNRMENGIRATCGGVVKDTDIDEELYQ